MGAGFGAVQALLIIWLAGSLLAEGPIPRLAETAGGSTAVRTMTAILPPPTEIAVGLGGWLDDTGLPDVFIGFEPLPGPPVDRPADPTARAIARAAEKSTLKVSAATCGLSSVGTGFVVAYGFVVTNAHVVAGANADGVRVNAVGGRVFDAVPVLFDPDLDVALLRVDGLTAPPLFLARKDPGRGDLGAALGYPGGGGLTIVPAAVSGHFAATGLDIYGESRVRRQVLELRAAIDRGDSGGPFVLADGTVGGVVFAEAKTNPDVGYALSATEVSARIAPGLGRYAAVDTGQCVRT
jgi:S1-C subfamily serine protease